MLFPLVVAGVATYIISKSRARKKTRLMQHHVSPWSGNKRRQQLQEISSADRETDISDDEQWANRYLIRTSSVLGLATLGAIAFPPLRLLAAAGAIWNVIPLFRLAYTSLVKERRVGMYVLDSVVVVGALATNHVMAAALGAWLFSLSQKLVLKTEDRSQRNLTHVFRQQSRMAWVQVDESEMELPVDALKAGDVVIVNAGETIPIDGAIVKGDREC